MYPLPAHTVQLVLQYISPLSDPLPPHLISIPLRQRHHFLQISTASPLEYLCWPSPDNAEIINLLDRLTPPSDLTSFPTRYTSDSDSTFAHVQVSNVQGLRMLFHWDDTHGWKYHDLRIMPFPSSSYTTPQESLACVSTCILRPSSPEADRINDAGDSSYWNAYEAVEHDMTSPLPLQSAIDTVEGENAYWAQYASVQGSADSTVPSPLLTKLRLTDSTDDGSASFTSQNGPVIDIPVGVIYSHPLDSKLEPPSPDTLAHLLSAISPRKEIYSPVPDGPNSLQSLSAYSVVPSPEHTLVDAESVSGYLDASIVSPVMLKLNGVPLSEHPSRPRAEDTALTDSIKGLYYLWKAGREGESDSKNRAIFLRIVQAAIAYE